MINSVYFPFLESTVIVPLFLFIIVLAKDKPIPKLSFDELDPL